MVDFTFDERISDFERAMGNFWNTPEAQGDSTLADRIPSSSASPGPTTDTFKLEIKRLLLNGKFLRCITSLFGEMGKSVVVGIDPLDDLIFSTLPSGLQERVLGVQLGALWTESYMHAITDVGSLDFWEVDYLTDFCYGSLSSRKTAHRMFTSWGKDPVFPGRPVDIPPNLTLIGYQYCPDNSPPSGLLCRGEAGELFFLEIEGDIPCRSVADGGPFRADSQANMDLGVTIKRPGAAFQRHVGDLFLSWAAARESNNDFRDDMSDSASSSGEIISIFGNDGFAVLLRSINSLEKAFLARSARSFGSLEWPSPATIRSVTLGREQSIFAKQEESLLDHVRFKDELVRDASALFSGEGSILSGDALCSTSTSTAIKAAVDIRDYLWDAFPEPKKKLKDDEFNPALAFLANRMHLNLPERAEWVASRASQYSRVSFKGGSGLLIPTYGKWLLFSDDTALFPPRLLPFERIEVSRQISLLPKVAHALGIPSNNDAMGCILSALRSDGRNVLTLLTEAFPEALRVVAPATRAEPVSFYAILVRCRRFGCDEDLVGCMAATAIGASSPVYVGGGRYRCYFDTVKSLGKWPGTGYHLIADCPVPCPGLDVHLTTAGSLYVHLAPGYMQNEDDAHHIEIERGTIEPANWVVSNGERSIQPARGGHSLPGVAHMRLNRLNCRKDEGSTWVFLKVGLKKRGAGQ